MDITLAILIIIILYILYFLLIEGMLWKIILGVFGWFGMYWYLNTFLIFHEYPFNNDTFSWASVIPTIIILLAMAHTKS